MKAILVVDLPDDYETEEWWVEGELRYLGEDGEALLHYKDINDMLKPMPKKIKRLGRMITSDAIEKEIYAEEWHKGWNMCIDEISDD